MSDLFFVLAIVTGFIALLCLGALLARMNHDDDWRPPMARRVNRDVLPPPSPACERSGSVVQFKRINGNG